MNAQQPTTGQDRDIPLGVHSGIALALEALIERYRAAYLAQFGEPPSVEFDPQWRSPCELERSSNGQRITWRASRRMDSAGALANLERALDTALHPSILAYYTSLWFAPVRACCGEGELELIGVWNESDLERLQANIIGHALQQHRRKLPFTVFFALTIPESEHYLAIDNASGAVVLEEAGSRPKRVISPSLEGFLATLEPHLTEVRDEP